MVKRTTRQPRAYVFVFQLGKNAKVGKKRVPAAFTTAPCYYYRDNHQALARKLQAIPEPDVSEDDAEVTFAAIDAFVERCELKPELYTDAEIEADEEHPESRGFHAAASYEKASEALARGGFVISRVIDPLAVPKVELTAAETVERAVEDLERHLDLTSLTMVLGSLEEGTELPRHASQAESLVTHMLGDDDAHAFGEKVCAVAPGWHTELRDTLLLLVGGAIHGDPSAELRALFAALPAVESEEVKRQLDEWGLPPSGTAAEGKPTEKAKPAEKAKPVKASASRKVKEVDSVGAKIARIEAAAKKAGVRLPKGASEAAIDAAEAKLDVTFPAEVRAFYLAHDGGPKGEIVCGNRELLSLAGMVRQWQMYKEAFDAGELDEDVEPDEGVEAAWWIPAWIPVTYELGGNHDVLDLSPAEGGTIGQIVSVWHDDASRSIEGTSFLSWLEEQRWGDGAGDDEED